MKNIAQQLAELYERENRRKGRWRKVVTALAAVVVFVTTYALILPGITLERDPVCGMEEHTHTADCYTQLTSVTKKALVCNAETLQIHQHTQDCYNESGELVCGYADFVVHTHDENCYDENGSLVCTLPEIELHTHDESCYDADGNLICGKPEVTLHTHDSSCYDENGNLICKKLQVLEHHHTESCFETVEVPSDTKTLTCGMEEHTHTDECYASVLDDMAAANGMDGISLFSDDAGDDELTGNSDGAALLSEEERADFKSYIETVTYKDLAYNPTTDRVEVSFKLTFAIGSGVMHPSEGVEQHSFKYTLPEGVVIPDDLLGKTNDGYDTGGEKGFEYKFVKNSDGTYDVQIDFLHSYIEDKDNFEGYIEFNAYANATKGEETEYKYSFNDKNVIDIKPEEIKHPEGESMHYNIKVDKSASGYNYDENKITYTIIVDSTKGSPNPLNLTDVLNFSGLKVNNVQPGSVVREDRYDEWNMIYGSQTPVDCTLNYDSASGQITMTLPGLGTGSAGNGQRYTITYDVYLDEPAAGSQYTVSNSATVSGTEKGETVTGTDETTTTVDKDLDLHKTGTYNKDTNAITWVITVNKNGNNIAGCTLTDEMFDAIDKSTANFSPDNGIAWDGDALKFSGVNGDSNDQTYTITYTTAVPTDLPFTDGVATVDNKAIVTPPSGEEKNAEASVTIDKTVDVGKKGEYDKSQNKIKWTITVNQNGNPLKDTVLTDTMFNQVPADSITVSPDRNGMTITTNADGTIEKITFNESAGNKTYTITYYTTVPSPEGSSETVEVKNGATVTPPDLPPKTDEETVVVNKNVDFNKWGSYDKATDLITWTITVNKNGNDLTGKVLTDEMFKQFTDKSQITITPANGYEWNGNNLKFTALENGVNTQTYTITYTTQSGIAVNATDKVANTVGLDGKETTTEVPVDRTITIDKSGAYYDAQNKRIWWTIYLNSNYQNIAECTLTDTKFSEMVDGTLEVYSENFRVDESDSRYPTVNMSNDKVSSIVFNAIGETNANTNRYTIKYATPASPGWDSQEVTNEAIFTPPDGKNPSKDTDKATIPAEGSVVKTAETGTLTTTTDGRKLLEITWKMEVKVPSSGLPAGTTITDTLKDDQWMTYEQIEEWGSMISAKDQEGNYAVGVNYWWPAGETYTIKFTATDGTEVTYADIVANTNDAHNKKYTGYTITFLRELPEETYGNNILWIQYKSYADVSSVKDTQKYQNTISITPPGGTTKDSTASYDYRKAGVYKTDGNGNKDSTPFTTQDGQLVWKVRVRTSQDCSELKVVDTLPQGVTLTGIKLNDTILTIDEGKISCNPIWGNNKQLIVGGTIEEKTTGDEITLTLSSKDGSGNSVQIPYRSEFYIYYTCKINPGILNGMSPDEPTSFTNHVTAWQDDTPFSSDSHTQEVKYDKTGTATKGVDKNGEWKNDSRRLNYSVVLNPEGKDLVEGKDTLTLTDTLGYRTFPSNTATLIETSLFPNSVKLYKASYNESGDLVKGEEIKDWTWKVETKTTEIWDSGLLHQSVITATVPDSTPMIFEYAYRVWLPEGSTTDKAEDWNLPSVWNDVSLNGMSESSGHKDNKIEWKEVQTSGGITYDRALVLYKVEAGNYGKTLPGAEFTLYDASKNQIGTYTTDSNGSFIIKWDETKFQYNKLYYLVETTPPKGYLKPEQPEKYWFYFSGTDTTNKLPTDIPENAVDLSTSEEQIYCENEKATTSITVNKKWLASDGKTDITDKKTGSVTFDLYQIASTTPPSESGGGTGGSGGASVGDSVSCIVNCNYGNKLGAEKMTGFDTVKVGDTVKISVNYTWNAQGLNTKPKDWQGVSKDENVEEGYSNNGTTYDYTCVITDSRISFHTGDQEPSIVSVTCTLVKAAPTPSPTPEPGIVYKDSPYTINPNSATGWKYTIDNLPKQGTVTDGSGTHTVYYTYYIKEHTGNYSTEYGNNDGIVSGTITVTNTESDNPGYELPATGGTGTAPLYTMGAALSVSAGLLLVHKKKRRKEGRPSS